MKSQSGQSENSTEVTELVLSRVRKKMQFSFLFSHIDGIVDEWIGESIKVREMSFRFHTFLTERLGENAKTMITCHFGKVIVFLLFIILFVLGPQLTMLKGYSWLLMGRREQYQMLRIEPRLVAWKASALSAVQLLQPLLILFKIQLLFGD